MNCDFTYKHYIEILEEAKKGGYRILPLREFEKAKNEEKAILLRHDIDLSIRKAWEMAKVEYNFGTSSSYYVRIHGLYNIFDSKNYRYLTDICLWGHEIGVQFEPEHHLNANETDLEEALLHDKNVLEKLLGIEAQGFCIHSLARFLKFYSQRINADFFKYDASSLDFFGGFRYISDSNRYWRDGCLCNFIGKEPKLHALIHPFWWTEESIPVVALIEEAIRGDIL